MEGSWQSAWLKHLVLDEFTASITRYKSNGTGND